MKKVLEIKLNPEMNSGVAIILELDGSVLSNDLQTQFIKDGTKAECKIYDTDTYDDRDISAVQILKFWEKPKEELGQNYEIEISFLFEDEEKTKSKTITSPAVEGLRQSDIPIWEFIYNILLKDSLNENPQFVRFDVFHKGVGFSQTISIDEIRVGDINLIFDNVYSQFIKKISEKLSE